VIPVIDRNYDINDLVTANLENDPVIPVIHPGITNKWYQEKNEAKFQRIMSWFWSFTGITMNEANIMK
jgi:hypothetical protein